MQPVLNIDDVKRVEVALTREGVSVAELMHRAGLAAAREALEFGQVSNVVVLAGLGNNGGDGWVAAEALRERGVDVTVVSPIDPDALSGDLSRQVGTECRARGRLRPRGSVSRRARGASRPCGRGARLHARDGLPWRAAPSLRHLDRGA